VCLVVERDPIVTAKQVASIDVLSGGRVLFGVGVGWILEEIKNHGVNPSQRWAIQNERIQAMRAIWTSEQAEFHGEHVDFDPIYSWPKPLQRPHPPVLVGGAGRSVFKRVLAYGDEWMPEHGAPVEELAARIGELQTLASAAGRGRIPVTLFNAPPERNHLQRLRDAGVNRAVLRAPSTGRDDVEQFLDRAAQLLPHVLP
jgi:probable F420-dependent oxidoreductase